MNLCIGDRVVWDAPQFKGGSFFRGRSTGKPRFVGNKRLSGVIERDSYGAKTGQHTFTVRLEDGSLKRVMGRNLYRMSSSMNGARNMMRRAWPRPPDRKSVV